MRRFLRAATIALHFLAAAQASAIVRDAAARVVAANDAIAASVAAEGSDLTPAASALKLAASKAQQELELAESSKRKPMAEFSQAAAILSIVAAGSETKDAVARALRQAHAWQAANGGAMNAEKAFRHLQLMVMVKNLARLVAECEVAYATRVRHINEHIQVLKELRSQAAEVSESIELLRAKHPELGPRLDELKANMAFAS